MIAYERMSRDCDVEITKQRTSVKRGQSKNGRVKNNVT